MGALLMGCELDETPTERSCGDYCAQLSMCDDETDIAECEEDCEAAAGNCQADELDRRWTSSTSARRRAVTTSAAARSAQDSSATSGSDATRLATTTPPGAVMAAGGVRL